MLHNPKVLVDHAIHNFSGGPGALAPTVLAQASQSILALPETGISILGMSHRSDWFRHLLDEAEQGLRQLLQIPANYHVLFLQGGSSLQFSMIAMNFLRGRAHAAQYLETGYWSAKATPPARLEGDVRVLWDGRSSHYNTLPEPATLDFHEDAAYVHYVSNETVEGLAFPFIPDTRAPLICDMSSDLLSQPIDVQRYALIYAHAQKNLGPAGVTLVIIRDDFAHTGASGLPAMLDYRAHIQAQSIYNTPPVFSIYVLTLVTRWLMQDIGGLSAMRQINQEKAHRLQTTLQRYPDFYRPHAQAHVQSMMNCSFYLADATLYDAFFKQAAQRHLVGLEGHRSLGGIRASLYNAVTLHDVDVLCEFLRDFQAQSCST